MSGLFGSTVIKGNRITDFASTGARVGIPLPFGFGTFVVEGNIIWAPLPPKENRKVTRQGKGGVKQETYTYTLSYAVAFCTGPTFGFRWIKRNGKIVYSTDPAFPVEDQAYATKWLNKATLYYGTKTQLPDSTIESYEGTGQVSAFRDLTYAVIEDEDTTNNGGAPASYQACVIANSDVYLTTPPYPFGEVESVETNAHALSGVLKLLIVDTSMPEDEVLLGASAVDGLLRSIVTDYSPDEEMVELDAATMGGELRSIVKMYSTVPEEVELDAQTVSGTYKQVVVPYENYEEESVSLDAQTIGGSLS